MPCYTTCGLDDRYMTGGSGVWYNCDTAWDVIAINEDPTPSGYAYVSHLSTFWREVVPRYQFFQPNDDVRACVHACMLFAKPNTNNKHCFVALR